MLIYHKGKKMPNRQKHTFHPWGPLLEVAYDLLNHAFATKTKKENDPHEASFRELFMATAT